MTVLRRGNLCVSLGFSQLLVSSVHPELQLPCGRQPLSGSPARGTANPQHPPPQPLVPCALAHPSQAAFFLRVVWILYVRNWAFWYLRSRGPASPLWVFVHH